MELILIRHAHAENNANPARRREMVSDLAHHAGLTEKGQRQAKITSSWLEKRLMKFDQTDCPAIDLVGFTSRLPRAIETANILWPELRWQQDARLNEADRGIWSQLPHLHIFQNYPDELARRAALGWYWYRPIGGENWPDIEVRVMSWLETLERLIDTHRSPAGHMMCICAVVHGSWYQAFRMLVDGVPVNEVVAHDKTVYVPIENASVSIYRRVQPDHVRSGPSHPHAHWKFHEQLVPWKDKL